MFVKIYNLLHDLKENIDKTRMLLGKGQLRKVYDEASDEISKLISVKDDYYKKMMELLEVVNELSESERKLFLLTKILIDKIVIADKNLSSRTIKYDEDSGFGSLSDIETYFKLQGDLQMKMQIYIDMKILMQSSVIFAEKYGDYLKIYYDLLVGNQIIDNTIALCINYENNHINAHLLSKIKESFIDFLSVISPVIGVSVAMRNVIERFSKNNEVLYESYRSNRINNLELLKAYLVNSYKVTNSIRLCIEEKANSLNTYKVHRERLVQQIQDIEIRYL